MSAAIALRSNGTRIRTVMRFLDEYRDRQAVEGLLATIRRRVTRPWTVMEVCGGQTHTLVRYGLDRLLPPQITMVHGPGCPVCVTALETIDRAHAIAARDDVTLCSFGDMLRVPGSHGDLFAARARGADVRVIYGPLDAVRLAADRPDRQVVLFAVGFETTAPANATAAWLARRAGLTNFSLLVSHVRTPPAISAILNAPGNRVQAFLGPGHVATIMGLAEYAPIARTHGVPIVITGFEPVDLLRGIVTAVALLERGTPRVVNAYTRAVRANGNDHARALLREVFEVCDQTWRGVGAIPQSGLRLSKAYQDLDAMRRFAVDPMSTQESSVCIGGAILRGAKRPPECPAFGTRCTPERPLGAPMVSAEGACAAYHRYRAHPEVA